MATVAAVSADAQCLKCGAPAQVLARSDEDTLCHDCFMQLCRHRFRSSFGKSHLVRNGDRALVAVSNGANSAALLHLVALGCAESEHRKMRFQPLVCHLHEGSAPAPAVLHLLQRQALPFHVAPLAQQLHSEGSATAQAALRRLQLHRQLSSVARAQHCRWLLLGDSCQRLAARLLADIAQGRGAHCSDIVAFHESVPALATGEAALGLLRPLRDFANRETAELARLAGWERLGEEDTLDDGIQSVTMAFVAGLDRAAPASSRTVLRTGEKLVVAGASAETPEATQPRCALCGRTAPPLNSGAHQALLCSGRLAEERRRGAGRDAVAASSAEHGAGGDTAATYSADPGGSRFCFGCTRLQRECPAAVATQLQPS